MEDRTDIASSTRKPLHFVALNFRVPFEVRQKFKAYAVQRGMSMTDVLIAALRRDGVLEQD